MFNKLNEAIKEKEIKEVDQMLAEAADEVEAQFELGTDEKTTKDNIKTIVDEINHNVVDETDELINDEVLVDELKRIDEVSDEVELDTDDIEDEEVDINSDEDKDIIENILNTDLDDVADDSVTIDDLVDEDNEDESISEDAEFTLEECAELVID